MKSTEHGGNTLKLAQIAACSPEDILDFSVNLRPEGTPDFLQKAFLNALKKANAYPSPYAEELRLAASKEYRLPSDCFVFGNGSNELIHALARVFAKEGFKQAYIIEPAFSEYALACQHAEINCFSLWGEMPPRTAEERTNYYAIQEKELSSEEKYRQLQKNLERKLAEKIPSMLPNSLVFIANPANPSGFLFSKETLLNLINIRTDIFWIIDEAFIAYAGDEARYSLLTNLPTHALILRSLTKFHAVAGVRLGFLATKEEMALKIRQSLPAWTVNNFAIQASLAVFEDTSDFAEKTRYQNQERRQDLIQRLQNIKEIEIYPSAANYVLFRLPHCPDDFTFLLLKKYAIALRDCSNYYGLEDGTWYRVAVRFAHEHEKLVQAIQQVLTEYSFDRSTDTALKNENIKKKSSEQETPCQNTLEKKNSHQEKSYLNSFEPTHKAIQFSLPPLKEEKKAKKVPALMLQGTSSNAGKSILAAAYCRIFQQDGYKVAPFKAQNMSLNSGVTLTEDEMGRAQIIQAQAARIDPDARMNPILLKPHSDTGSQVIVMGKAIGHMRVAEYFAKKKELWQFVSNAYDSLAEEYEIIVLEGAGSPAEINLKSHDVVNMRMAEYAKASVLLVGDIDRGGVYASFLGTWLTFTESERKLLTGYLVNRFRGDASFLEPAHQYMQEKTNTPVLGTIPYIRDINIPEEDMAGFSWASNPTQTLKKENILDIGVVMLRHVSNYTDLAPLMLEPDLCVRPIKHLEEWGNPDLIIIPGSKSVVSDLKDLQESGLAEKIVTHAKENKWIFGICGGLQILGKEIRDPFAIETKEAMVQGLGIMDLYSTFAKDKTLIHVAKAETPLGVPTCGYEIHHGITEHGKGVEPLFLRADKDYSEQKERICGYVKERCWASYLHGIFDDNAFRRAFINHVREDLNMPFMENTGNSYDVEYALNRLANIVRENSDMNAIYQSMGLKGKKLG